MENNHIGKVSISTSKRDKTLKNKSCDLHTTMDFGSVMPGKVMRVVAGASFDVSSKERVLLTDLVRPCFGRITLKSLSNFVPLSDLTRNYAPLMAQEAVYRDGTSAAFVPQLLPSVSMRELSLFVLFGSHCTVYSAQGTYPAGYADLYQATASEAFNTPLNSLSTGMKTAVQDLGIDFAGSNLNFSNAARIGLDVLTGDPSLTAKNIYLSNPSYISFFDYRTNHPNDTQDGTDFVSLEGADYVVPVSYEYTTGSYRHYLVAFRLSSFGRRLRKVLIGCGWQFNLSSTRGFSILPLAAYFKSYFDVFGLTLYQNWEETYCYRLLQGCDLVASPVIQPFQPSGFLASLFRYFVLRELGCTYYTSDQDFISSHTRSTAVSPNPSDFISSINTDVDPSNSNVPNISTGGLSPSEPPNMINPNGHALVNSIYHGQLDSEILKRLYRWTNVNTVAGRRIADLLRAQGLGAYVDECRSNFIGSWDLDLNIYDLPSQSDTYEKVSGVESGKRLGEFGAFGKSSGSHPPVHYETNEDGYYVQLLVIVPKGGYAETVDPDAFCLDKFSQYNPEFDSKGMEFDRKDVVQGSVPWSTTGFESGSGNVTDSFGLAPRYFNKKFGRNVLNGDFSLRGTRDSYLPFCLERIIDVNEHSVGEPFTPSGQSNVARYITEQHLPPSDLPIAGNVWRYLTRYDWIAQFNRIFYNSGTSFNPSSALLPFTIQQYEYFSLRDDNFIVHMIQDIQVRDQMLPVQLSFETTDDEHHADSSMRKA